MLQRPRFRTAPLAAVPSIRRHPCAPYSRFARIVRHLPLKRIKEEKARVPTPQLVTRLPSRSLGEGWSQVTAHFRPSIAWSDPAQIRVG
jgi:hypothetical protein